MSLSAAMHDACRAVGIQPPRKVVPGRWVPCPVEGKAQSNTSGRVRLDEDQSGGVAWNHVTGQHQRFTAEGLAGPGEAKRPRRDRDAERREREAQAEAARVCAAIVQASTPGPHPYLAAKGFPTEVGLVHDDPRPLMPAPMVRAIADLEGPLLIVPGRVAKQVQTVQFIDGEGRKKNALGAPMRGACHRIATGRETWVCEGIATALTVRAALRLLGRSATVLSAFSAANVAKVAERIEGSIIAADHDKPLEQLGGVGTGEFYAAKTGRAWVMPPALGDFNDMHQSDGLRAVAVHLRGVKPP